MIRPVPVEEALSYVRSGDRVFVHTAAAAPRLLVEALAARAPELTGVEVVQLHTEGPAPYAAPGMERSFRVRCLFIGPNLRTAVAEGRADYVPVFLSEVPALFRQGILPLDVALVQVSPPDRHGFCSLGISVMRHRPIGCGCAGPTESGLRSRQNPTHVRLRRARTRAPRASP